MKRNIVIAALTATALIGGGTATALAVASDGGSASTRADVRGADDDNDDRTDADFAAQSDVTAADALAAALRHTPGTAASVDLDDDGAGAWDVDVIKGDGTEYSVTVSPDTGKVVGAHQDIDDDNDADDRAEVAALKGAKTDAREAALAAAAKGTVTEVSLDDDDDSRAVVWSVDTTKGEWKVDLTTGKVTADRDED
ncbi:PepSY domain-containing protein [Streptomyces aquilus]|uniref:PepSY domain-containing protein n=1 Tax=Streptomyces aquilus TaxID=2548456 RepID=UPI0037D31E5D